MFARVIREFESSFLLVANLQQY